MTAQGQAAARYFRETGLYDLLSHGWEFEAVCEEVAEAVLASLVKVHTATGYEMYVAPEGGP